MVHLGDITKIDGRKIVFADTITFGSPCQDLSIAGKRAGLAGEPSGLFMVALRIIKEMREASGGIYPTFVIWENVLGAFSSNGGEDFQVVLEELARIKEPSISIPRPANGKWAKAGFICGNGWSIAWRTFDAQFWGVPQRRRRIAVVLDLGGQRAGEILFERTGVSGHPEPSIPTWKGIARNPAGGTAGHDRVVGGKRTYGIGCYNSKGMLSDNPKAGFYETETSRTLDLNGGNPACNQGGVAVCCLLNDQGGQSINVEDGTVSPTLRVESHAHEPVVLCRTHGQANAETAEKYAPAIAHALRAKANCSFREDSETFVVEKRLRWIVRRLTPTECERLQGFPDGWTDICEFTDRHGVTHAMRGWLDDKGRWHKSADSPRYKALGNSIALPQWWWITCKMAAYLPERATLGSLFDGIGGFPLVWETRHGKGTALWASEIEPFPIAVTKERFQ